MAVRKFRSTGFTIVPTPSGAMTVRSMSWLEHTSTPGVVEYKVRFHPDDMERARAACHDVNGNVQPW